jgi:hypothetical protein
VRLLIEIIIIGALIYLGWEKPFKERVNQVCGISAVKQTVSAAQRTLAATPTPTSTPTP